MVEKKVSSSGASLPWAVVAWALLAGVAGCGDSDSLAPLPDDRRWMNLTYATLSTAQRMDLYLPPEGGGPFPLIVWIHGGGWRGGDKRFGGEAFQLRALTDGFAVASLNYRLSGEASHPAQIHDVKTAIRWLRTNRKDFRLRTKRIGVWGSSAGGHLVSLLGTSGGVEILEGASLGSEGESSRVQAVVDWYGPTDLNRAFDDLLAQGCPTGGAMGANSTIGLFLGASPQERPDLAAEASPITYVTPDDPPFLIQHGSKDCTVPVAQGQWLYDRLEAVKGGNAAHLDIFDAGHGGAAFRSGENLQAIMEFFLQHIY